MHSGVLRVACGGSGIKAPPRVCGGSGIKAPPRVARGSSGAKAPPLAARPFASCPGVLLAEGRFF